MQLPTKKSGLLLPPYQRRGQHGPNYTSICHMDEKMGGYDQRVSKSSLISVERDSTEDIIM